MKKIYSLFLTLLTLLCAGFAAQAEETPVLSVTPTNDSMSKSVTAYTATFTLKATSTQTFTVANFNNNNKQWTGAGVSVMRCGSKSATSKASIASDFAFNEEINKVTVDAERWQTGTNDIITSATLYVSSSNKFEAASTKTYTADVTAFNDNKTKNYKTTFIFNITTPAANQYYKIEFDCPKMKNNGVLGVNKFEFYGKAEEDNREECGLAYSAETVNLTLGQEAELPTLSNTNNIALAGLMTYTSSNEKIATVDETGKVTIIPERVGKTTITASFEGNNEYKTGTASYTISVNNTEQNPLTVAQAIASCTDEAFGDVFVKGIITRVTNFSNGSLTYYIADEAGSTNDFQIYSGKNKGGEAFTSESDLAIGGTVIVKGSLVTYKNNPELNKDNVIVEYTAPAMLTVDTPTFSPDGGEVEKSATVTIACATDGATIRYAVAANAEDINEAEAESWEEYTEPIVIDEAVTIKAIAMKDGCINSNIATASYTVCDKAKTMEFNFTDPTKLTPAQAASGTIKVSDVKFWSYSISFTATKGTSTDATIYYNNGKGNLRVYNGATMTIVSEDAEQNNITTIIFTLRQGAANAITEVASASKQVASAPLKTISSSNGNKTYTWTGDAKEVNLNVASNIQIENVQVTCANQISTGVDDVMVDGNEEAPVEYYNLQGVRVENPAAGQLYIKRQGSKATKVIVR